MEALGTNKREVKSALGVIHRPFLVATENMEHLLACGTLIILVDTVSRKKARKNTMFLASAAGFHLGGGRIGDCRHITAIAGNRRYR